jgi:hypothetical protein
MTDLEIYDRLQRYVGMPYVPDEFDCADLAKLVQAEVFGRSIALPDERRRPLGTAGQRGMILSMRDQLAAPVAVPFTGCGALFTEENAKGGQEYHIGTVCLYGGQTWILHNSYPLGGVHFHDLAQLQRWGMRLEGFYAWK